MSLGTSGSALFSKFNINFPIVYGGGIGSYDDVNDLLNKYDFSGINIAAAFHSDKIVLKELKSFLLNKGHNINII